MQACSISITMSLWQQTDGRHSTLYPQQILALSTREQLTRHQTLRSISREHARVYKEQRNNLVFDRSVSEHDPFADLVSTLPIRF